MKIKYISLLSVVSLFIWGCNPTPAPAPDPEPEPEAQKILVAPSNLQVEVVDGVKAVLTWENESNDYDGVALEKAAPGGHFKALANIPAGTLRYEDDDFSVNGEYIYRLCSYKGNRFTDYERVNFTIDGIPEPLPEVRIDNIDTAPNMIVVRYTITADLDRNVENGIVWSYTSTDPDLETGESFKYWKKLAAGSNGVGVIIDPAGPVTLKAYAKVVSDNAVGYSDSQTAQPAAEPEPYKVTYEDITSSDMPSEIKVYKAHTTVTGHPLNIWYAIADLSTGNVELRALCPNGYAKTSQWAKSHVTTPYIFTNGGYFYSNASLSYVMDQGVQKAENDSFLSRSKSYYASRGVFGVTSTGESSVCWRYGGTVGGGPYFYGAPLPQIDGADVLKPSATFPTEALTPGYYNAIGGGPVLVKDGKIKINFIAADESKSDTDKNYLSNFELFYTDIYNKTTRQPRTAIGRTSEGKVVLMVVDGRKSGVSEGVVLTDMARLMTGVGCVDVLNLDGGGSSVFCMGPEMTILNTPSDSGGERSVISMVGFAKK